MRRRMRIAGASIALVVGGVGGATAQQAGLACNVAAIQRAAPEAHIVQAEMQDTPVRHCRVDGYVLTSNPGPGINNFRLQLPEKSNWKGRFYFVGLGGTAGYVPTTSQIPGGNPMKAGFAVAGTDTGHLTAKFAGWSFLSDPTMALDHTHRGAHVTTQAAQKITRAYYGVEKMWRYHSGCSGGGRMGGEAAMMHPEDYDGILLGQSRVGPQGSIGMMKFIHAAKEMTREPGSWLSPAKLKMVEARVTAACDMTDGAKDGVIWDSRLCKYDVARLKCKKGDGPDCLTQPEITSIKAILDGPRGPKGDLLQEAMPISNMSTWSMFLGSQPPPWAPDNTQGKPSPGTYSIPNTTARGLFGPEYDVLRDFDLKNQAHIDAWTAAADKTGFHRLPDLTPMEKTGKVMTWVGSSDPCCSAIGLEKYVKILEAKMGADRVSNFLALYPIPGQGHCGGGTGPADAPDRLLSELIAWVEQGKKPAGVVMHSVDRAKLAFLDRAQTLESGAVVPPPGGASREFLVCPYPLKSVFDKTKAKVEGAVFEAANWSCKG